MSNVSLIDGHIDEPRMTDEEIRKALECLAYWGECKQSSQCPYYMDNDIVGGCDNVTIAKEALDLINHQQAYSKRLENNLAISKKEWKRYIRPRKEVVNEEIRKFAEELKSYVRGAEDGDEEGTWWFEMEAEVFCNKIDNIAEKLISQNTLERIKDN